MNTLFNRWRNCCPPRAKQVPPSHVGSDPTALLPAVPHAARHTAYGNDIAIAYHHPGLRLR